MEKHKQVWKFGWNFSLIFWCQCNKKFQKQAHDRTFLGILVCISNTAAYSCYLLYTKISYLILFLITWNSFGRWEYEEKRRNECGYNISLNPIRIKEKRMITSSSLVISFCNSSFKPEQSSLFCVLTILDIKGGT